MDSIHCMACFSYEPANEYFVSSCGHILCRSCLNTKGPNTCPTCVRPVKLMPIDPEAKANNNMQMLCSNHFVDELCRQMSQIQKFQSGVTKSLIDNLKRKQEKYRAYVSQCNKELIQLREKLKAAEAESSLWKSQARKFEDENKSLKRKLTGTNLTEYRATGRSGNPPSGSRGSAGTKATGTIRSITSRTCVPQLSPTPCPAFQPRDDRMTVSVLDRGEDPVSSTLFPDPVPPFPTRKTPDTSYTHQNFSLSRLGSAGSSVFMSPHGLQHQNGLRSYWHYQK